jgi:GNAT superfamily N-acetyltransferase
MITRSMDPERDLDGFLRVIHLQDAFPRNAAEWWERHREARQDAFRRHLVGEVNGEIVAVGVLLDFETRNAINARLVVDVAHRGRGHGRRMAAALDELIAERAPTYVDARVSDGDQSSRSWAQRRGFRLHDHAIRSRLDLRTYDALLHHNALTRAEAAGLRFEVATEMDRLYDLYTRLVVDGPNQDEPPDRDTFRRHVESRSDGIALVALHGSKWIGTAIVTRQEPDGAWNEFTGVLPEHRGAGIATALKVLATNEAAGRGWAWIETINDARNAPMLAVNRALGYRPIAGTLFLRRTLQDTEARTAGPQTTA